MLRIVLKTGLAKGASWPIGEEPLVIGRDRSCAIVVPDSQVSRRHCEIRMAGGRAELHDLGSSNATLVNGHLAADCRLKLNDELTIGQAVFVITDAADAAPPATGSFTTHTTVSLAEGQAVYLSNDASQEQDESGFHKTTDVIQLFRHSRTFSRATTLDALIAALQAAVLERFAPRHYWFALASPSAADLTPAQAWSDSGEPVEVPQAVLAQAIAEMRGFLVPRRVRHQGRVAIEISLTAPIAFGGHPIAAMAFQSLSTHRVYDETDLHFLVALAHTVAPFFGAVEKRGALERELSRLRAASQAQWAIIGDSRAMQTLHKRIAQAAATEHAILITGETGTGKELAAHQVHEQSERSALPFVAVNCAAIPNELFGSELFGHEKGAFTGAASRKTGLLETCGGGTLFLDEIGDLSPENQARILRAIETKRFRRVGGTQEIEADFRVVAATNRDLGAAMDSGLFRADLYHRLRGVEITVPPLRDHKDDVRPLADHFLEAARPHLKRPLRGLSEDAIAFLENHGWPGNVRELKHGVETAATFANTEYITAQDLDAVVRACADPGRPPTLADMEQKLIADALAYCGGNVVQAALVLGISKATLYRRLAD